MKYKFMKEEKLVPSMLRLFADSGAGEGDNKQKEGKEGNGEPKEGDNPPGESSPKEISPELKAEISKAVQEARQQEKDKLYPTIESQKETIKSLESTNEALTNRIEYLSSKLEEVEKMINKEGEGTSKEGDNKQKDGTEDTGNKDGKENKEDGGGENPMLEQLSNSLKELEKKLKDAEKAQEKRAIADYRLAQIAKANIPEKFHSLIPDTSNEAVDKAITAITEGLSEIVPNTEPQGHQSLLSSVKMPGAPGDASIRAGDLSPEDINRMSPEQYAEFRKHNSHMFGSGQGIGASGLGSGGFRRQ